MNRKIPMRQCVGCREMKPKREMVRILRTAEEEIVLDATGKKNGRGAYLCPNRECLASAMKHRSLERALKATVSQEIYVDFEKELKNFETG